MTLPSRSRVAHDEPIVARYLIADAAMRAARAYMTERGFRPLFPVVRSRWGTLHFPALGGDTLAFCQVDAQLTVAGDVPPPPLPDRSQRIGMRQLTASWLHENPLDDGVTVRSDLIVVTVHPDAVIADITHLTAVA